MSRLTVSLPSFTMTFIIGIVTASAFALGPLVAHWSIGPRELVIFVLSVWAGILILAPSERVLQFSIVIWILTFGFGWRTVHVTDVLSIHPSEVLAWLLFLVILVRKIIRRAAIDLSLPLLMAAFVPFIVLGIITAVLRGTPNDVILQESKIFLVLIPSYYLVKWLISNCAEWEHAARLAVLVVVYVSCLGLLDFFAPNLSQALAGQTIQTIYRDEYVGFSRVGFVFYGNFSAGFFIFTFFGLSVCNFLRSFERSGPSRVIWGLVVLVELAGIYLSGYRALWYSLAAFVAAYALVRRRAWVLVGAALAGLPMLPAAFFYRFQSVLDWRYADSSQFQRINRATNALDLMYQSPLTGLGWGGSGYVHSDLIQLGANLGMPALAVFVVWILSLVWKSLYLARRSDWIGEYAAAFFATLCGLLVMLAGEGIIVFVQLVVPVWFLIAMAHKLIELESHQQAQDEVVA